jgi:tetratricopeptide (TPR) repeat protein
LEFVFGDLVADFSVAETQALCALTHFTLPAKVENIAAVVNPAPEEREEKVAARETLYRMLNKPVPVKMKATVKGPSFSEMEIERALRSLANRSLVIPSTELETYKLVPLVADFLRSKKPEVIAEAGERLEQRALALIMENGFQNYGRFPVLEAAWPSLAPAIPLFLAGPNDRLQQVCEALREFLNFTGRWDERLALCQLAEARAVAVRDYFSAGWRAYNTGMTHFQRRQATAVHTCADRVEAHWQESSLHSSSRHAGVHEHAAALQLRGLGLQLQQDHVAAIATFRGIVTQFRNLSTESTDVATALNALAGAEQNSGDLDGAERDCREALRIALKINHASGVATFTGNLAGVALAREDWPKAESLAHEALLLAEKLNNQDLIASDCQRVAVAMARQGRGIEGLPFARRAVEIYTHLVMKQELATAQETLQECKGEQGE